MRPHGAARFAWTALLVAGLVACGRRDEPPLHLRLAGGYEASALRLERELTEALGVRFQPDGPGGWLRTDLPADGWRKTGLPGVWRQPRRAAGEGLPPAGPPQRLTAANATLRSPPTDDAFRFVAIDTSRPEQAEVTPGTFCALGDAVYVTVAPEGPPPTEPLVLCEYVDRGHDDGVAWRVAIGEVEAEGLPLVTGERASLALEAVPAGRALSFWTTARPLASGLDAPVEVRLRVRLDGEPLGLVTLALDAGRTATRHETLPLPELAAGAALEFELAGAPALAAVHQPRLHPADAGRPGARPWGRTRPDLVLVVADTYRADNLTAYGGDPALAPELNALAARARVYTRAWAPSPWTLPSHAALFSGLVPPAAQCTDSRDRLGDGAVTLAEELRRIGYRTVAITDRGFVSRDHGLSQGFEWFQEVMRRGEDSLVEAVADARAQLDADDGRPLFLFFQTYRAHTPYEVSAATRAALGGTLASGDSYAAVATEFPLGDMGAGQPGFPEFTARLEALYRGASRDTSRGLGRLVSELERARLLDDGHLFLTSDHGEAFGEHGVAGHGSTVHEPQLRIPLLHAGPGVDPGRIDTPCSLLDVPSTLVALAGLRPPETWMGRDLRTLPERRVLFAFVGQQSTGGHRGAFAARRGDEKLYYRSGDPLDEPWAFDLAQDPAERLDVFEQAAWAAQLADDVRSGFGALVEPRVDGERAVLSAEAQRQLDALGYR